MDAWRLMELRDYLEPLLAELYTCYICAVNVYVDTCNSRGQANIDKKFKILV